MRKRAGRVRIGEDGLLGAGEQDGTARWRAAVAHTGVREWMGISKSKIGGGWKIRVGVKIRFEKS